MFLVTTAIYGAGTG